MRRLGGALALTLLLLTGCAPDRTPLLQTLTERWGEVEFLPAVPSFELPDPELLAELPRFSPALPIPAEPPQDPWAQRARGNLTDSGILARLVRQLEQSGRPETEPTFPALFVGKLEGGVYAYNLGDYAFYLISRKEGEWRVARICADEGRELRMVTHQGLPLLACSARAGTSQLISLGALYRGEEQLFRIDGITPDGLQFSGGAREMPDLIIHKERRLFGGRIGLPVVARYHLLWQEGRYQVARIEWQEDAGYHLARFIHLWQSGRVDAAAAEFAEPPLEGLEAYLRRHAPALIEHGAALTYQYPTRANPEGRHYFRAGQPVGVDDPIPGATWVWFEVDQRGRISAIGEEAGEQ